MPKSYSNRKRLTQIAHDYYLSDLSITELSKKYDESRYLITKALDEARTSGIVSIKINAPIERNYQLEEELKKRFNIPFVAVVKESDNGDEDYNNVLECAAERIQILIEKSHIVGMTWGSTVYSVIEHFKNTLRDDLTFTQFIGENMKYNSEAGSRRMVERAASHYEAKYLTLPLPLYIVDDTIREHLPEEPAIRTTLAAARRMDFLFCGLGTISSFNSISTWKSAKNKILPYVNAEDIAGMLYARPYDINGNFLTQTNDKTTGITIDEILTTPRRLGIVHSKFKTSAALGALRGNMLTDMVMSEGIAQRILITDDETSKY
ncbi:sugar-binding transcriptional regulator [Pediococcus acidilactici]|jgi:DNA-binding transcriptional regulator LsrR (DeoR family)|uniref:sugar-binding transcriptional regulator n=1 Tax=Pediococcus acidilactici TaxID=1254 RepID=UPI0006B4A673|nr:sugar-binding domain-containing protein [Pediococcus acidilactici]KAF0373244.1 sugar-binding transcriptional regulator [Pediococcus acidilactici]KAF0383564.1 sugar-binding transcriptional regulator [Pediococcus acidilactici]KAF0457548.1 sugar-binding transcriptional regulator [Pediococcus acidilactici]KAF0477017.1 sugar-binding transcriptional regulator [Pediococcus acidilactici]KAF0537542.1 sugar-binding transcriptional regulator [Pediococcus acidilactici]